MFRFGFEKFVDEMILISFLSKVVNRSKQVGVAVVGTVAIVLLLLGGRQYRCVLLPPPCQTIDDDADGNDNSDNGRHGSDDGVSDDDHEGGDVSEFQPVAKEKMEHNGPFYPHQSNVLGRFWH